MMCSKESDTQSSLSELEGDGFASGCESPDAALSCSSGSFIVCDTAHSDSSPERYESYQAAVAKLSWLRKAMQEVALEPQEFQRLAQLLGKEAAAQVVAFMLARRKQQEPNFDLQAVEHLPRH